MKLIAVENCQFTVTGTTNPTGGTISISTLPSEKGKLETKKIYKGPLSISASGWSDNTGCAGASGTAMLNPTAQKTKLENQFVVRKDDEVNISVNGLRGGNACSFTINVKITDAGQTKGQGN